MKTFSQILPFCALLVAAISPTNAQSPEKETSSSVVISAEVLPYEISNKVHPKVIFEQQRAKLPTGEPSTFELKGLAIPSREKTTMIRVTGVITAPITGDFAFLIHAPGQSPTVRPDETELWICDDATGEWRLAQTSGNPIKRNGRTHFDQGVPRRFELWTMGKSAVSIDWEVKDYDPVTKGPAIKLARQLVPADALQPRSSKPDDRLDTGLKDSWKKRNGLNLDKSTGPDSPWGDPDKDGLLNWQEQRQNLNPLKPDGKGADGLVLWELWRDIPGQYVFDLRRAPHFPSGSREIRYLDRLVIPTGNGAHYGSRIRGLLVAPLNGEYTFKVSADDSTELWLGTDEHWETKRMIASADQRSGLTRRNEKGELLPIHPEQSATITLKADQKYYIEVLYKQDTGIDLCAVSWVVPGSDKTERITAKNLACWQPSPTDVDDDGLPDDWQRSVGLLADKVSPSMRHCEADPDFDGATNRAEWLAGTNPLKASDLPINIGMLTCQSWTEVAGQHIEALVNHANFPNHPSATTQIDNFDFSREGDNYGLRIRGYLTAPEDGNFSFSISGNNAAILYLGESDDKFTKRIVSRVEVGTNWRSFTKGDALHSGPVRLTRGKKYYIEVIYKRGVNGKKQENQIDHGSVAWTRPGRKASVIAPEFFSPYQPDPRDSDDDDLPDEWEKLHHLDASNPVGKNGAWGDPDGDGLENFREFQRALDPAIADVNGKPGLALWEGWYNKEGLITAHKNRDGVAQAMLEDLRFPLKPSHREWRDSLDAPRNQGTNFGARLRAQIVAPVTGDYFFSIAGRDVGELFLSPDKSKFNRRLIASFNYQTHFRDWESRSDQMSAAIHLKAGEIYYIEAIYGRGAFEHTDDFFSIGWKQPGEKTFKLISSDNLVAFFRDPNDQDDDDLPDDWETRYGLDATEPRGDHGPQGDPDRDRYTNAEELALGTNPNNLDTDGDGISDYDELHTYKTNPLVKDTIPPVELQSFPLTSAIFPTPMSWMSAKDGSLKSVSRRGSLSFEFEVEKPGICILEIVAASVSATSYNPPIPFLAEVNGVTIGSASASTSKATFSWMTPWLSAGKHTFTVNNRNLRAGSSLVLQSVKLLRHDGEDKDGNGVVDWLENILLRNNSINAATLSSATSPACIEGFARFAGDVSLKVSDEEIKLRSGIASGWYANVPLDKMKKTALHATFEGGTLNQTLDIEWLETDLLSCPPKLIVRVGDSLKVRAQSEGEKSSYLISCDGEKVANVEADGCSILTFGAAGEHKIIVQSSDQSASAQRTITVSAVSADFGGTFDVASGSTRKWNLPGVPRELFLQADPILTLKDLDRKPGQDRIVNVTSSAPLAANPVVLARLYDGGPIVASTVVESFYFAPASVTRNSSVIRTLPDGTRVVRVTYAIDGKVPSDLSIWIQLYVTDAVFANGDSWYELTAADFNENGEASLEILKAPGLGTPYVCHWINPFMESPDDETNAAPVE